MADEIRFEIKEYVGTISKRKSGWNRELNLVSWNGQPPKYDIREWSEDHSHMNKGITLFADEMRVLVNVYTRYHNRKLVDDAKADEAKRNQQYWADRNSRNYNNSAGADSGSPAESPDFISCEEEPEQQTAMGSGGVSSEQQIATATVAVPEADLGTLPVDGLTDEELEAAAAISHGGAESACAETSTTPF